MRRDTIEFDDFEKHFIQNPDGYFPVYSAFEEDDNSNHLKVVEMDMICEWRLSDSKVKFVRVPFETEEQFRKIVAYLRETSNLLHTAINKRLDDLEGEDYKATRFNNLGLDEEQRLTGNCLKCRAAGVLVNEHEC